MVAAAGTTNIYNNLQLLTICIYQLAALLSVTCLLEFLQSLFRAVRIHLGSILRILSQSGGHRTLNYSCQITKVTLYSGLTVHQVEDTLTNFLAQCLAVHTHVTIASVCYQLIGHVATCLNLIQGFLVRVSISDINTASRQLCNSISIGNILEFYIRSLRLTLKVIIVCGQANDVIGESNPLVGAASHGLHILQRSTYIALSVLSVVVSRNQRSIDVTVTADI